MEQFTVLLRTLELCHHHPSFGISMDPYWGRCRWVGAVYRPAQDARAQVQIHVKKGGAVMSLGGVTNLHETIALEGAVGLEQFTVLLRTHEPLPSDRKFGDSDA